jgi:outer membrane protein, heavy metal efflux system
MKKTVTWYVPILSMLWCAPAVAQPMDSGQLHRDHVLSSPTPADAPPLTLDAAIAAALANNPTLVALRRELDVVRQRPAQDRALAPPTLEAAIWQWPLDTLNPLNTNMYMVTARQDIPGPGKRTLRAAVTEKDVERAVNDIALRAREVVAQVKRAYSELFVARQAVMIHQAGVALSRQIADLTTAKYEVGHGNQQDTLMAVVGISKLHSDLIELDEQQQLAAAQLNTLLNRDPDSPIGELVVGQTDRQLPPLAELQARALDRNLELTGAHLDVERAEAALAVADREYKPDFMIGGGYQLMPRSVGAWTASIGITWPGAPWARRALDARKAEATAEVAAARAREQTVGNAVRLSVQQAYVRATAAAARASLLNTTIIPQSQQVLDVSRVAYQSNRADIAGLVEQQHELLEARLEYFKALSAAEQARADLEYAIGDDLTPALAVTNGVTP